MIDLLDGGAIYNKVEHLLKERGWSIYELAKKANVPANTIYHWRDRKSSPTLALLVAICDALNIKLTNFLLDDEELISLADDQRQLLNLWRDLSQEQQNAIINLMKSMNRHLG